MKNILGSLLLLILSMTTFADEKPSIDVIKKMSLKPFFKQNKFPFGEPYYETVACPKTNMSTSELISNSPITLTQGVGFKMEEAIRINTGSKTELREEAKFPKLPKDFYGYQINKDCAFVFSKLQTGNEDLNGPKTTVGPDARFEFSATIRLWLNPDKKPNQPEVFEQHVSIHRADKSLANGNLLCLSTAALNEINTSVSRLMKGEWINTMWDPKCPKEAPVKAAKEPARAISSDQK